MIRWILFWLSMSGIAAAEPDVFEVALPGGLKMEFVEIPAGDFVRGSPKEELGRQSDETPEHRVTISQPFRVGRYEVTQAQWVAVTGDNPSTFARYTESPQLPVERITWDEAVAYAERLTQIATGAFRLPSEAEWEYVCRAGTTTRFPWGSDIEHRDLPSYGWYYPLSEGRSRPVGTKLPNAWGLYDLHGGVWEWCRDGFEPYPVHAVTDPQGASTNDLKIIRGGSWFNEPEALRSANRHRHARDSRLSNLGFRLVWIPSCEPHGSVSQTP
ncbi:formylglycine-generating enzyme family protein [Botrimarina hoheduenensis]|uniref:Serine/threonine-protein kinase pkn1 n=1 Tax=Botrimarina hoheduenensis TaxID=2528000 RepID=A0A5C5VYQ4_9BACT|nr:formylglycine-generating enzyme family protein [Botrimarina hoheduenensis]TWT43247.1 Serine/threonine-protein kinase pkn1 [Botrimarina hoheduenensis]